MKSNMLFLTLFFASLSTASLVFQTSVKQILSDNDEQNKQQIIHKNFQNLIVMAEGNDQSQYQNDNANEYPNSLVQKIEDLTSVDKKKYRNNPKALLMSAVNLTPKTSQSMLLIVTIDKNNMLQSSKVGNSGYVVYKKKYDSENQKYHYSPVFSSQPHEETFNVPYLVGAEGLKPSKSLAEHAGLKPGYIVVTYSSVVMENLFQYHMDTIINNNCKDGYVDQELLAEKIAQKTYEISKSKQGTTPYSQGAVANGVEYEGGVEGNIVVMVSEVVEEV